MSKINIQSISKAYGGRDVFRDFSLEITGGTRLAVVGVNGAGKSTLLKLLAGQSEPDSGKVALSPGARLGYVAQELEAVDLESPLLSWVLDALPSWHEFWQEWDAAAKAKDEAKLLTLSARQTELEHQLGYSPEHRAKAILLGLGFAERKWDRPIATLSGGWRERAKLARVLVAGADVLLLDEPTNHLDLEAVAWLENYLLQFEGVLVFVAHERVFLDRVATHTLYLGDQKPVLRPGTFTEFLAWREEMEKQWERQAASIDSKIKKHNAYIERFRYKATKARQAQSKLKSAEKLEKELAELSQDRPETRGRTLDFTLPEPARGDKTVLSAADLTFHFPDQAPLWPKLTFHLYRGQKVALAGPNGAGKTTLLKCISGDLTPTGGTVRMGTGIVMGYFSQHQTEILQPDKTVMSEMRRLAGPKATHNEVCSVLGLFLLGEEYWERSVSRLSGGEKSRLLLAGLFTARANFLVLDEPTNHLDLESREALIRALGEYTGTILFVAHDRRLLGEIAEEVWGVGPEGLTAYQGGYEEYVGAIEAAAREAAREESGKAARESAAKLSKKDEKELKRRQAEERNRLYKLIKPKQEAYAALEAELETVMTEQSELEAVMADPETYADAKRFSELGKRYGELSEISDRLLFKMEALEKEIQALEADRSAA